MKRSPLIEELERGAAEGTADAVALASCRKPRVRATRLPDAELVEVPAIDGLAAGRARALADLLAYTHGGIMFEQGNK